MVKNLFHQHHFLKPLPQKLVHPQIDLKLVWRLLELVLVLMKLVLTTGEQKLRLVSLFVAKMSG